MIGAVQGVMLVRTTQYICDIGPGSYSHIIPGSTAAGTVAKWRMVTAMLPTDG